MLLPESYFNPNATKAVIILPWVTGTPLFPFGHGLSYSSFDTTCAMSGASSDQGFLLGDTSLVECNVTLAAGPAGEEVLMLYHSAGDAIRSTEKHPVPIKELVGFERVQVSEGVPGTATFKVGANQLGLVDQDGNRQLIKGDHTITVSNGVGPEMRAGYHFIVNVAESRVLDTVPPVPAPYSPPPSPPSQGSWLCSHSGSDKKCVPTGGSQSKGDCMRSC